VPLAVIYITSALLALGAAPLPYGYYTFLRLVACGVFAFLAYIFAYKRGRFLPYIFGGLALLFNPFIKIHLPKEVWVVVDIASAVLLLATSKRVHDEA
jgi:hypothetical protein